MAAGEGAIEEATDKALEAAAEHPVAAIIVLVGTGCAIALIAACRYTGMKINWNLGPWGFDISKDRE